MDCYYNGNPTAEPDESKAIWPRTRILRALGNQFIFFVRNAQEDSFFFIVSGILGGREDT